MARDLARRLDPVVFARSLGIEPDSWQAQVLRGGADRLLMLCARQAGKSTTAALLALHTALFTPRALVLLLSPSLRQSGELFRKVAAYYAQLTDAAPAQAESTLHLELANGSRVISLPATEGTIRGYSGARLLVLDEASRIEDALYFATRPMLAISRGRLVALSTPFGRRGWFYDAWHSGGDAWQRVKVTAQECPRIAAAFLAEERRALGPRWYGQEYDCEFTEMEGAVFSSDVIAAALSDSVKPLTFGR